jgi:hypothetical protein
MGGSNRRRSIPWILTAFLTAAAVCSAVVAGIEASSKTTSGESINGFAPVTGFGGYRSSGDVEEISAVWTVPAALAASKPGSAVTWIGAQNRSGGPFIQLGSYAIVYNGPPSSLSRASVPSLKQAYGIFWSDQPKHFRLQILVQLIHAGDSVHFEMVRNHVGWKLSVKNLTHGWTRSIEVHYPTSGHYAQGEWLQEDPAFGLVTSTDVPYADTSAVTFQHLEVNGKPPKLKFTNSQALSTTGGIYLAPTHVEHDGFSLVPAIGAARQYLMDAETLDSSLYQVTVQLIDPKFLTKRTQPGMSHQLANDYGRFAASLKSQNWPTRDEMSLHRVEGDLKVLGTKVLEWGRVDNGSLPALMAIFADSVARSDSNWLRSRLGLPPSP